MARKGKTQKALHSLESNGFYTGIERENMLYAVLIRSPSPSGKIKSVTAPDLPEGYYLITAKDLPLAKNITLNKIQSKIFGYGNISYAGEPLALLCGEKEQKTKTLCETVNINLEVENLESALNNIMKKPKDGEEDSDSEKNENTDFSDFVEQINEMPSLNTVIAKNQLEGNAEHQVSSRVIKYGLYENLSEQEADEKLLADKKVISETWVYELSTPPWQETSGAFAYLEDKKLHIYIPTRWTSFLQECISEATGIDIDKIFIHKTKVSNIYPNGIWRTTQIGVQIALATFITKRPVRLVFTPEEQKLYMSQGFGTKIAYQTVLNENGRIETLKADIDIDIGVSNPFAQEITDRIAIAACNYYKPLNMLVKAAAHTSKNPPTSISTKSVASQAFFAAENHMQKICDNSNFLPDEIRQINSVSDAKAEKQNPFPFSIATENYYETIKEAVLKSDFKRKYASFHMEAIDRLAEDTRPFFALPLRGIGFSSGYNNSGYKGLTTFSYDTKIEVTLTQQDKLIIKTIKPSEVIQKIWKNTASEILQLQKQNIIIDSNFPVEELPKMPEESFSSIGIMNEIIKKCCMDIQKKRFHQALPITAKRGISQSSKNKWDKEKFSGTPFFTTSFASCVVEVELDTYTYNEKIKGIWIVADCGELFDETAAEKTIKLEVQQELSLLVKDKTLSCDGIYIQFIKSGNNSGQVGGLVHNILPAAFSSAMSLALATELTALPFTEEELYELIKKRTQNISNQKSEEKKENKEDS